MRVAAQIAQNLGGAAEGRLGINHPLGLAGCSKMGRESRLVLQRLEAGEELQRPAVVGFLQGFEEQAAKQARENPGRQPIQREPSGEMPPPGTTQCTWG